MPEPLTGRVAQLHLRIAAPNCEACYRETRTAMEALDGVLLVEVARDNGGVTVTYDSALIDAESVRKVSDEAGCISTT